MLVRRVWFTNDDRRELKETIEQLKILYLPITFGVSEKRLRGWFIRMHSHIECIVPQDSVEQLENSVQSSHVQRELKETIEQLKILYLPITFGVSEKRLRWKIFDEMRSDAPPR
ncbi:hypothetical protein Tsp_10298 [Trichinella spiralis]|nr:hypothetical protein Tsp_10298 [Trichinella spiralis]